MFEDFRIACIFLTRLPLTPRRDIGLRELAGAVYMFPVVGLLVGLAGGLVYAIASGLALPTLLASVLALAAMIGLTGGLHEDGLADTADALGARGGRERALDVMRDSRIGSFGALALTLILLARLSAYASFGQPAVWIAVAAAAAAASRAALPVVMLLQPRARTNGLAAEAGQPEPTRVWAAIGLALVFALLLLPPTLAIKAGAATALAAAAAAAWFERRFGGYTGDTLGAVQQIAEVAFLIAAASGLGSG